ncbi:hypothetical protein [Sorangium sp. So ce542]|uniref:hypothetical protein n=1 Tax=Sorangium sp. So ce542 TaxID=3133316 RepID=UPI003F62FEE9
MFKAAFSQVEHAAGELRQALPPELSSRINFADLRLCPGSFAYGARRTGWRRCGRYGGTFWRRTSATRRTRSCSGSWPRQENPGRRRSCRQPISWWSAEGRRGCGRA